MADSAPSWLTLRGDFRIEVNEVDVVNRVNTANPFAEGVLQPMALVPSASADIVQLALLDTRASDKMGAAIRRSRNGHHQ